MVRRLSSGGSLAASPLGSTELPNARITRLARGMQSRIPENAHKQRRSLTSVASSGGPIVTKSSRGQPKKRKPNPDANRKRERRKEGNMVTTGIVEVRRRAEMLDQPAEKFDFGVAALQGPRETMEDEAVVFESGKCGYMYAMVLDGHDGLLSVQWLADHLFDIFSEIADEDMKSGMCELEAASNGVFCPINLTPTLTEMFHEADRKLLEHLKGAGGVQAARSGSTATVALVKRNRLIVANVGDSRLVICRNGRSLDITTEHRLYGRGATVQSEIQRVESVGGWVEDGRVCGLLAVSRAFGDWELKEEGLDFFIRENVELGYLGEEDANAVHFTGSPVVATPDVTEIRLTPSDEFIIIGTDGIWDVLNSATAVRLVRRQFKRGFNAQEISDYLCDLAIRRYTTDNVACVVIDLRNEEDHSMMKKV